MKYLKFPILLFFLISETTFAQNNNICNIDDWLGKWKGTLEICNSRSITYVPMEIIIAKTNTPNIYRWSIFYEEGEKKSERAYELIIKDLEKGNFIIDEKNDILLDMKYLDSSFYSMFEVKQNLLFARYTLHIDEIEYETIACKTDLSYKTGSDKEESEIITNYPVFVSQKAHLKKQ